jgi:hypothetical protein
MKRASVIFLVFFGSLPLMFSQDNAFPDLQGYKRTTNYPVYTPDNLHDFIDGAADTYLSFEFKNCRIAEYLKGKNVIKLEIYEHKNNIEAFGIYSAERNPSFRFINIGAQGYITDASLNFYKGGYYVKLRTYSKSEKVMQSLESLAMRVADMLKGENKMPPALLVFPEAGKNKNEETYINQNVLGHEFLNGAFKANYETGDLKFSIFFIDKETVEEARKSVMSFLSIAKLEIDDNSEGKYVFRDGYNGDIFLSWKENKIVIISGLTKDRTDLADRYSSEILR